MPSRIESTKFRAAPGLRGARPTRSSWGEQGSAMVEAALTFWIFVLILLGMLDLSPALNRYLQFTQVTYEGLRNAANSPDLEPSVAVASPAVDYFFYFTVFEYTFDTTLNRFVANTVQQGSIDPTTGALTTGTVPTGHLAVHNRMAEIIRILDLHFFMAQNRVFVASAYVNDPASLVASGVTPTVTAGGGISTTPDTITIAIRGTYLSRVGTIPIPMSLSVVGPFLY